MDGESPGAAGMVEHSPVPTTALAGVTGRGFILSKNY